MPSASATIDSFVSPEEFRAVILNFEAYPKFLPEIQRVVVHERDDTSARATFHVSVSVGGFAVKTEYTLRYTIAASTIQWTLESSPQLEKHEGRWLLEDQDGEVLASLEGEIVSNLPISLEVQEMFAREQMPRMMDAFRDRAESL